MKGLKIFAFVVLGIFVLTGILVALAFTPGVQTWAVRKVLADQPGMKIEIARIDAGLSGATITSLNYAKDGVIVTAKAVTAKYDAWDYLRNKRINADSVVLEDLVVDLRNAKPAAEPADDATRTPDGRPRPPAGAKGKSAGQSPEKKAPFEGLLKTAQLPFDVRVQSLSAQGRALLPAQQLVVFDLKGSGIETGQRGKVLWTVDFSDEKPGAALRALRATGSADVQIAKDGRIDSVEIETTAAGMGPKIPHDQLKIAAKARQSGGTGDETYGATVSLVRRNQAEPLLKTNARFAAASRDIRGDWEIAVRSEQLAGLLAGMGLPEVAANGTGKFSFMPDTGAVSAEGNLQGRAAQLQKLSPALEAIGAVQFKTVFDGGLAGDEARLEKLNVEVTGADGKKFAQIDTAQRATYGLKDGRIVLANPRAEVARVSLQQLPLAWAQPVAKPMMIESGDLSLALAIEAEPDGSRIRARALEPLAIRNLTLRDEKKKALVEQLALSTRPSIDYSKTKASAQFAEFKASVPAGDAITGTFSAEATDLTGKPAIAFVANLQAKVVAALKPYLPVDTGPLAISISAEGNHQGETLTITKAATTVNREAGPLVAAHEMLQPLRLDLKKSTFVVPNPTATAARLRLGQIPLAWAEPFVANSKLSGEVSSGTIEVSIRSVEDVTLTTTEPLTLRGVTASLKGKPTVQSLDITANLTATKRGDRVVYEVRRIEMKEGANSLAGLTVAGEAKLGAKTAVGAKGNLEADVAALMRQPALASFASLSSGRVTADFDANITETMQAKAKVSAKNLVAKQDSRALGDLDLTLDATMKADGTGTVAMPLTLTNAQRKSDLAVNATFGKAKNKETFLFTGKITSNNLVVDDFEPLAGLAPAGDKPSTPPGAPARTPPATTIPTQPAPRPGQPTVVRAPAPPPPGTPGPSSSPSGGRDTEPFWKAVNGKLEVDLKRVVYGKDYLVNAVRGTAVITDSKLSVDGLEGRFKENPFKLAGGLTFAAQQPKPYTLTATADVQNFDVGEFLREANPGEKPALETKATITARLNGTGGTVGDLGKNAFGRFELTGTKGVARYLARKGTAGAAVNIASIGLAVLGAARGSDTTMAIAELARALNEVPFDAVKMQVERAADLSFKLTSLELVSPLLRMTGSGGVASKSTEDLANAPMNIVLQLGARGELAHLLGRVGMLGQNQDARGYQLMTRSFTVGGTPSKPDSGVLWKILGEAALGALAR